MRMWEEDPAREGRYSSKRKPGESAGSHPRCISRAASVLISTKPPRGRPRRYFSQFAIKTATVIYSRDNRSSSSIPEASSIIPENPTDGADQIVNLAGSAGEGWRPVLSRFLKDRLGRAPSPNRAPEIIALPISPLRAPPAASSPRL